ncbi:chemotaxis protein CheW [Sphingomonas lenta]|uniref:Chemotaxis protein CheW n=1 Tax=Sphingomonas lenta TaxID=1141887 RepID=A0A2A2SK72_9SPHN|nr:chemotaxis protein CheW [Sphingomonas lenta]PAX09633.1 chemotaxis protein CheW [Sphingomonas lenta]
MTELFLIAHVAGRGVAIPADRVDSVVDIGEIVKVPRADPAVRGLAALRSRVVTVVDTGLALGLAPLGKTARAVITRVDGHYYAVLVDSLEDVASFERRPIAFGAALGEGWRAAATGLVERDGEPLLVIDPAALVPAPLAQAA